MNDKSETIRSLHVMLIGEARDAVKEAEARLEACRRSALNDSVPVNVVDEAAGYST